MKGLSRLAAYNWRAGNGLPVAIEVAIWFGDPPSRPALGSDLPEDAGDNTPLQFGDDFPEQPASDAGRSVEGDEGPQTFGEPHRLRGMVVPHGPAAAWRGGR